MKLNSIPKEELELMGYDDIAYIILEEEKTKMKINDLFKKVCDALGLSEDDFINQIADFFEILTTDKKFIMLDNGYWDLKTRHSEKLVIEEDDEEYEDVSDDNEEETDEEEDTFYDEDADDDTSDDDLKDLVVISDDEEE